MKKMGPILCSEQSAVGETPMSGSEPGGAVLGGEKRGWDAHTL